MTPWGITPRDVRGWRLGMAIAGLVFGVAGFSFLCGWFLTHLRRKEDSPDFPDQPSPNVLWQLGIGFAVLGGAMVLLAYFLSPRSSADTPPAGSVKSEKALLGVLLAAFVVPLVICTAAALESAYQYWPLAFGVMALGGAAWIFYRDWM